MANLISVSAFTNPDESLNVTTAIVRVINPFKIQSVKDYVAPAGQTGIVGAAAVISYEYFKNQQAYTGTFIVSDTTAQVLAKANAPLA